MHTVGIPENCILHTSSGLSLWSALEEQGFSFNPESLWSKLHFICGDRSQCLSLESCVINVYEQGHFVQFLLKHQYEAAAKMPQ